MPIGPTPIERVKRTNIAMMNLNQQIGFVPRHNLYTIDVDRGQNCYNCSIFGHITRNYGNRRIVGQRRRINYNGQSNLNGEKNLIVLN